MTPDDVRAAAEVLVHGGPGPLQRRVTVTAGRVRCNGWFK